MNRTAMAGMAITGLIYGGVLSGMILLFEKSFVLIYRKAEARHRLTVREKRIQSLDPIGRHLAYLLSSTLDFPCRPGAFLTLCGFLVFFLMLLSLRSFHLTTALLIGSAGGSMPYLFLRLRLETRRRRGSFEGEKVISELLRQYRLCGHNMYEAIEKVIPLTADCRVCCRLLYRMLLRLRSTGDPMEIRETVALFSYALGTNWAHMLSGCIHIAAEKGIDVSPGLEDIQIQMRQARSRMEERKRLNNEAMRLTLFMVPLLYLATVLLSIWYLEVPAVRFVKNQLGTPEGLFMFLAIAFLFVVNLAVIEIINNQKMDY